MPELPECDMNRRRLAKDALNRTIEDVTLHEGEHVDLPTASERKRLVGRQFTEAHRHGKVIFAGSKSGPWIAIHLGMTGSLRPFCAAYGPPDYAKLVIEFEGDRRLAFRCPRKLGSVHVVDDPTAYVERSGLGPDALEIERDVFVERLGSSRGALKSVLMDQKKLAGIGNLWSDEVLFQAGIAPDVSGRDLNEDRLAGLHRTVRDVLSGVVKVGADYPKLPRDWLISHRDEGETCRRCGGSIRKKTVGGRSAFFCVGHQAE